MLLDRSPTEAREQVDRVQQLATDAVGDLRSLVFELRPPAIDTEGLGAALAKHVAVLRRVHRLDVDLEVSGRARLRPRVDEELFKIAQEALQNALKHAAAARLEVRLDEGDEAVALRVVDDGVGFEPDAPGRRSFSLGLTSMEERAQAIGATLAIASAPGQGTTISVKVPV